MAAEHRLLCLVAAEHRLLCLVAAGAAEVAEVEPNVCVCVSRARARAAAARVARPKRPLCVPRPKLWDGYVSHASEGIGCEVWPRRRWWNWQSVREVSTRTSASATSLPRCGASVGVISLMGNGGILLCRHTCVMTWQAGSGSPMSWSGGGVGGRVPAGWSMSLWGSSSQTAGTAQIEEMYGERA